jgi:hypothetical protein
LKTIQLLKQQPTRKEVAAVKATEALLAQTTQDNIALQEKNDELRLELEMSDDLLTDAARIANARGETLRQISATIASVNSPNGTTRKLARIVAPAVADMSAKTLAEMPASDVFIVEGVRG